MCGQGNWVRPWQAGRISEANELVARPNVKKVTKCDGDPCLIPLTRASTEKLFPFVILTDTLESHCGALPLPRSHFTTTTFIRLSLIDPNLVTGIKTNNFDNFVHHRFGIVYGHSTKTCRVLV